MSDAINPRKLRPTQLMRLLNTAGFGPVLTETRLRRHRNQGGYLIGDGRSIDLFRYAAWLSSVYFEPKHEPLSYEERKRRQTERNAEAVRAAQDIAPIPEVADPERRAAACASFRVFCETYFPHVFYLPWSEDHLKVIEKIERAVKTGGLFALAMARGSGKTSIMQIACIWAALIGATPFVTIIAASSDRAYDLLETIKTWLETNDLLAADFPEVCYPIRKLDRIVHRQRGQKYNGEPTRIEWLADKIVLPTIPSSQASGVVISCCGMKGSDIRGQNHARADGQVVRPQLVMVDDPQTTESAWSESQSKRREAILAGDVLGMAGPGRKIAGLMACTVNGYQRCVLPLGVNYLTTFIDVQQKALYYLTAAWEENFTGYVVDYGTWPDQRRAYFTLRDIQQTLAMVAPGAGLEGSIYSGLEALCDQLLQRIYYREDGAEMRVGQCLIDANWGQSTDVVYQFCRQSRHAGVLLPAHGKYVGASSVPFSEYRRKRGDRIGHHWRIPNITGKRQVRHVLVDTNYWKTFVHARLAVTMGDPGCLSLFGRDPKFHQLLSEHFVAEYRIKTQAQGRTVDEWKLRASKPDNHWLDCLVGCAVGASIEGAALGELKLAVKKERKRVKLSDLRRRR